MSGFQLLRLGQIMEPEADCERRDGGGGDDLRITFVEALGRNVMPCR